MGDWEEQEMTTVTTSEVRAHLSDTLSKVAYQGDRVVITAIPAGP